MAAVTLNAVRKIYNNGHVAVERADVAVADGELLVLVGPSGCGKSTLLRLIAGLEEVTAGTIHVGEREVTHLPPRERDIAMVFQSYALYPHMSVADNLGFGLKLRGQRPDEIERRVQAAARMLDLGALLQRLPKQLSGGQRQRVALGRALVRQPQVFLLDEPLSNLDAKLRSTMRTEIARLHRTLNATMIYVTHDQIEAMTLGQRIVVMNQGVIQQVDAPMRIYEQPANLFVAGFLGNPAMTLFRGRVCMRDGLVIEEAGSRLPLSRTHERLLTQYRDQQIVAGIRPEDFRRERPAGAADALAIKAIVELIEAVGNEAFLHLRLGAWPMIARVSPAVDLPSVGAEMTLYVAPQNVHFFDAATTVRLDLQSNAQQQVVRAARS